MKYTYNMKITYRDGEVVNGGVVGTKETAIGFINMAIANNNIRTIELLNGDTGEVVFLYIDKQLKWFD